MEIHISSGDQEWAQEKINIGLPINEHQRLGVYFTGYNNVRRKKCHLPNDVVVVVQWIWKRKMECIIKQMGIT